MSFEEASTVFDDLMFIQVVDDEHSVDEERYVTIGLSKRGRLLMVAHADRRGSVRMISARVAAKREEKFYVETQAE